MYSLVARCPKSPGAQCNFFLWGKDDVRARELMALQYPEAPRTPTRSSEVPVVSLPTPNSGDSTIARKNVAFGWQRQKLLDASPTPSRFNDAGFGFTEHDDMTTRVIKLLRSNNIELKASTEVQLRHMISSEVGAYEIKLQKSGEAILELGRRLNELESACAQFTS
jgi:hypothetical protein